MSERTKLEQAIVTIEAQRAILGDAAVDMALGSLRQQLVALELAEIQSHPAAASSSEPISAVMRPMRVNAETCICLSAGSSLRSVAKSL